MSKTLIMIISTLLVLCMLSCLGACSVPAIISNPQIMIASGDNHTLALKRDGTVWAWGLNGSGQLGDGTTTNRSTPAQVHELTDVISIAAGGSQSRALKSDGTVWAWGYFYEEYTGNGFTKYYYFHSPVQVQELTDVIYIAAGDFHTITLNSSGAVWAWGLNGHGTLGDHTTTGRSSPVQVHELTDVVSIAAGGQHSLALKSDGTVWAWGLNNYSQLGDGTTTNRSTPAQVHGLTEVTSIAAGQSHSIALKRDGTVWAWGFNYEGQLGDSSSTNHSIPVKAQYLTDVISIVAGYNHSLALKRDGTVWACGLMQDGELVYRITDFDDTATRGAWVLANYDMQLGDNVIPMRVSDIAEIVSISAGMYYSVALKSDGTVWAWGFNTYSQLGDGTTIYRSYPVQVHALNLLEKG